MAGTSVYDFIFGIDSNGRVGDGERVKSRVHKVSRIVDEVFRGHDCGCLVLRVEDCRMDNVFVGNFNKRLPFK